MSTIKISQLPGATLIEANTANTIFAGVDILTGTTYSYSAKVLAAGLYANSVLNVGQTPVVLPNTVGQFSGNSANYLQINEQNFNSKGSADYVITADTGTDSTSYLDLGINNSQFINTMFTAMQPLDGYLYVHGPADISYQGNLILGTASSNANIVFMIGNTYSAQIVGYMTSTGLVISGKNSVSTSNLYATGNVVTNVITTPKGSGSNLLIDPDGTADVIFSPSTELIIQSGADSTGVGSGALQVSGGAAFTGNVFANNVYITSLTSTGNLTTTGNVTASYVTASYLYGNVVGSSISATGLTTNNITSNTITANAVSSTLSVIGTWTPNVTFATQGTVTYTTQSGSYVKTGRQVSAYFTISASTSGSSGNMYVANLPFVAAATAGTVGITTIAGSVVGPSSGNMGPISGNVVSGSANSQLYVTVNTGNGSMTNEPVTGGTGTGGIGTPFTISGCVSYISAS